MEEKAIKNSALLVATLAAFLTPFMASAVNIALPVIGNELKADAISLSWVATAYLLASAMFLVPIGRIADIYGRKKIFTYGVIVYITSAFLSAIAPNVKMLIFFRTIEGIGGAMIFGTGVAILTSVFPPGERGRALGINVAAVYIGLSVGPFLGGFLTQNLGWRSVFLTNIPLGFVIIGFIITKLKGEWAEAKGEKIDFFGSIIYSLSLVTLFYGFSLLPEQLGGWIISIGLAGLIVFIFWETKIRSPIIDIKLFLHNRLFAFSNLAALINYSATFAVSFLLSLYLQYIKGYSPQEAGLILVAQPIIMATFSPLAGRISDKIEPRLVASTGMALTAVGLTIFIMINKSSNLSYIILGLILLGFGFAFFSSPNTNAIMSSVEKRFFGVASGTLGTMRLTGQMFSMGIVMLIFAIYIGNVQIVPEFFPQFISSLKIGFIIFSILCYAGIFASLARGKAR